jgi:radical SAM protein with 4Fe4S-binding SPASM domain
MAVAKRFRKIYLEISNVCNLNCAFCPGTKRHPHVMTQAELEALLPKLRPWTDYLYFHLMGEPLCHPQLQTFLDLAGRAGFRVILTTNGTLLAKQQAVLLAAPGLHKVNISLHAFEANDLPMTFADYLSGCFAFGKAAQGEVLVCYRLWNGGGQDALNEEILKTMETYFPKPWVEEPRGTRIGQRIYLEYGDKFDWPDLSAEDGGQNVFCYGLRDQLGVLCDGTVVPCCLDHEGDLALGNLLETPMEQILESDRARAIFDGFSGGRATEELCRKCGYARRFGR